MGNRDRRPQYHVYLLRLWRESEAGRDDCSPWRFSLESPETHERFGFTSITALAEFLRRAVGVLDSANGTAEAPEPAEDEPQRGPE
jgi:hypothetical protein